MKKIVRIIAISLLVFIVTLFSGCGKTQIEKAQDKIVSIGEQFLNYELTADEAHEQLESIAIPATAGTDSQYLSDSQYLTSLKGHLQLLILQAKINTNVFNKIEEQIQDIKNYNFK